MKRNVAGQKIGVQMVSASDGSAFTGSVTVYVTGDAGTQALGSVSSGACTHEGEGYHTYAPAQAETNYDLIAFTFKGTGAVPVTVQVYPSYPLTGDAYAAIVAGVTLSAAGIAAIWDALTSGMSAVGSIGKRIVDYLTGDSYARLGAPAGASHAADIAAVKTDTAAILLDTGTDGVVIADKTGMSLSNAGIDAIWTRVLTESYSADGAAFTGAQALYEICQTLSEFAISGTTITVKKRDGSTTAITFTLNDATNPTSRTRAT